MTSTRIASIYWQKNMVSGQRKFLRRNNHGIRGHKGAKLKVQLFHHRDIVNGMQFTTLIHVKCLDCDGRHLAFARITPELLEFIRNLKLDVPDSLLNWKSKLPCPNNLPKKS